MLSSSRAMNAIVAAVAILAVGVFTVLYNFAPTFYSALINLWSFDHFIYPFLDAEYVPAQAECWRQGIDVYAHNPCDILDRPHDYSPLWLRIPAITTSPAWLFPLAFGQLGLFILSISALPAVRRPLYLAPMLLAVLSPTTAYAVERGNPDLTMFSMSMAAIVLLEHKSLLRIFGYSTIVFASLLKFYPFVLMLLVVRESFWRCFWLAATSLVVFAGYIVAYRDEIMRMLPNIPQPTLFYNGFGASEFLQGVGLLTNPTAQAVAMVGLLTASGLATILLAHSVEMRNALAELTQRELLCLVVGSLLIVGCFFAGRSIAYRGIHLLFVIPGLLALVSVSVSRTFSLLMLSVVVSTLGLMCYLPVQRLIYHFSGPLLPASPPLPSLLFWAIRESAWWWVMTVLAAVILRFVIDSNVGKWVFQHLLQRRRLTGPKAS